MKSGKAPGLSEITVEMLKIPCSIGYGLAPYITSEVLREGVKFNDWCSSSQGEWHCG